MLEMTFYVLIHIPFILAVAFLDGIGGITSSASFCNQFLLSIRGGFVCINGFIEHFFLCSGEYFHVVRNIENIITHRMYVVFDIIKCVFDVTHGGNEIAESAVNVFNTFDDFTAKDSFIINQDGLTYGIGKVVSENMIKF